MEHIAGIIREAGAGPLAFFALGLIILAYLSLKWFGSDHIRVRISVFLTLIAVIFLAPFVITLLKDDPKVESAASTTALPAEDSQENLASAVDRPKAGGEAQTPQGRQSPSGSTTAILQPAAPTVLPAASRMEQAIRSGRFTVYFAHDDATLSSSEASFLDDVADEFGRSGAREVVIEGHTDRWGSEAYNIGKSQRMAGAVRDYLTQRGVPEGAVVTEAFGESRPAKDTADGVPEALNRRVEIRFGR